MKVVESIVRSALSPTILSTFIIGYILYYMLRLCLSKKSITRPAHPELDHSRGNRSYSHSSPSVQAPHSNRTSRSSSPFQQNQIQTLAEQQRQNEGQIPSQNQLNTHLSPMKFISQSIDRPIQVLLAGKHILYRDEFDPIDSAFRTLNILLNAKCKITIACVTSSSTEEEQVIALFRRKQIVGKTKIPFHRILFCEQEESCNIIARQILPDMFISSSTGAFSTLKPHIPKLVYIAPSLSTVSDIQQNMTSQSSPQQPSHSSDSQLHTNNSNAINAPTKWHQWSSLVAYFGSTEPTA